MTRHKENISQAVSGGGILFSGSMLSYALNLIFMIVLARWLGPEDYGLYKLAVTATNLLAALSYLGLDSATNFFMARLESNQREREIWGMIDVGMGIPVALNFLLTLLVFFFTDLFAGQWYGEPALVPVLRIIILAAPLIVLARCAASLALSYRQVQYEVYFQDIGFNALKLVLCLLVLYGGFEVLAVATMYSLAKLIATVGLLWAVARLVPLWRHRRGMVRPIAEMLRFGLPLYLTRLVTRFGGQFEALFLGSFGLIAGAGIYSVVLQISTFGKVGFAALQKISVPIVTELHAKQEFEQLGRYYQTINKWGLIFYLPIFLIILLFAEAILSVFGAAFVAGTVALYLMAGAILFNLSTGICGVMLTMTGHTRLGLLNSLIYLAATIALDLYLIPIYELNGAAMAAGLTMILVNFLRVAQVYFLLNRLLPVNRSFLKPLLAAAVSGGIIVVLRQAGLAPQTLPAAIIYGSLLTGIYLALIVALKLSAEDRVILDKLRNRLPGLGSGQKPPKGDK